MKISLIVAMTRDHVIGRDGTMPWHLPAELKRFKRLTMGKPIIMGRKTFESLPGILPGRRHLVVSRTSDYEAPGAEVFPSLAAALAAARKAKTEEAFVIGGSEIFREALPYADRLYMTLIDASIEGDVHFPGFNMEDWQEIERMRCPADNGSPYRLTYLVLARRPIS